MAGKAENNLIEVQDMAQDFLDIAGVMLIVINDDQEVTLINKKVCEILGYAENEILGSNWFDRFIPERIRTDTKSAFIHLMSGKGEMVRQNENPVLTKNGEERIIEWQNTILRDHNGAITGTLSSGNDITEHRQAEEKIAISQQELITKHKNLSELFKKVEITNKEQQKIMDAVGDMIILTDFEGKIKRVNRAARDFSDKSYDALLGGDWEEFIYDNGLEAMTLFLGSTELFHKPAHKWFVLNAYPFEDSDLNFSGTVITLHDTTEMRQLSEELEKTNITLKQNREKLKNALSQISNLMENVINQTDTSIRLDNDYLVKCYEIKNCTKKECICFEREAMRCWQIAGTYCGGEVQGAFAQKYGNCSVCEVFKKATADPIYQIGEQFNNMMHVIEVKNEELKAAYKELNTTFLQCSNRKK